MELGLDGKVVLVTGGTGGLGLALCARLLQEGARVALCGRHPDGVEAAVAALVERGGDPRLLEGVRADVTDPADLENLLGRAVSRWDGVDAVVNNAGASAARRLEETDDAAWQSDVDLKLSAAVRLTRLALPHLRRSVAPAVVNTLAIGGKTPGAASLPSSVTRAAGLALTKALSRELGPDGIRVNAVLIGLVESGQWTRRADAAGVDAGEYYRTMAEGADIPLGRVGRAGEYADLVAFLLSSRASYVTGAAVNLDGGLCAVT